MDMSFIDRLRKNSLFTQDNPNPLRPPTFADFGDDALARATTARQSLPQEDIGIRTPNVRSVAQSIGGPNLVDGKPVTNIPGDMGYGVEYKPTGITEQFVNNILNPPERNFNFQNMLLKNALANRNLDIKEGDQQIKQQRADIYGDMTKSRIDINNLHDLSDSQKLQMLQEGKIELQDLKDASDLKEIGARGKNQLELEKLRETGRENLAGVRGNEARKTQSQRPITPMSNTQIGAGQKNRAAELKNTDPILGKYIEVTPDGFSIAQPGYFGPTQEQFDAIKANIYGTSVPVKTNSITSSDMVEMITPDGKGVRMVPKDQVELAKSQQYKVKK